MKFTELEEIIKIVQFSFGNKLDEEQVEFWGDFLQTQSYTVSKKVIDYFRFESGNTFIPPISEFAARIKVEQVSISHAEARQIDSAKCSECKGLTWVTDDPSGCVPCSFCRASAYAKWEDAAYVVTTPPNQDELEGPRQSYQLAAKDNHYTGKPVEVTRAEQWVSHIKTMTQDSPIYPEGDLDPELLEVVDNTPKRKGFVDEF